MSDIGISGQLLGGIASPAIGDFATGFRATRQARRTREQEAEFNEMAAGIIKNQIGSQFADIAKISPSAAINLADSLGIPKNATDRLKNAAGLITLSNKLLQGGADPKAVGQLIGEQAQQLGSADIDVSLMSELSQNLISDDPVLQQQEKDALNQLALSIGEPGDVKFSATSQILTDGTTIQLDTKGNRIVRDPAGNKVTGQAAVDAIARANTEGVEVQTERAKGRARATKEEGRASALIDRGISAAESTAIIRRGLTLLETVETGGVNAISLAIKDRLGIAGADETELSSSLGKSILSQLRETFGAAFTENEGKRLERIEANFGKSTAGNKRLLQQALRISERTSKRARKAALDRGQDDVVTDIDDLLTFSLDIVEEAPQVQAITQPGASRFQIEVIQ